MNNNNILLVTTLLKQTNKEHIFIPIAIFALPFSCCQLAYANSLNVI